MPRTTKKTKSLMRSCLINGSSGRMGREIIDSLQGHSQFRLSAAVNSKEILAFDEEHTAVFKKKPSTLASVLQGIDYVIDFSSIDGTRALMAGLSKVKERTVLIGTTGLTERDKAQITKVAKTFRHKILIAGNTSLGVATLARVAKSAAEMLKSADFDIEIVEGHHRMKVDTPSGTALLIAKVIQHARPDLEVIINPSGKRKPNTIGIHAVRGGGIIGEHAVRFISTNEELSFGHRAFHRSLFANGAIQLLHDIDTRVSPGHAVELFDFLVK